MSAAGVVSTVHRPRQASPDPQVRAAQARLAVVAENLRQGRAELLAIAHELRAHPDVLAVERKRKAGDEDALSLAWEIQTACMSIAVDYLSAALVGSLAREGRRTSRQVQLDEARFRARTAEMRAARRDQ